MKQQEKIAEQLSMLREMHAQRVSWYEKPENQTGFRATNRQPVAGVLNTSKTQIASLDQHIQAAGGHPQMEPVNNLYNPDDTADIIDARVINAYEEIITNPTEPQLPEDIIALLREQQDQLKSPH